MSRKSNNTQTATEETTSTTASETMDGTAVGITQTENGRFTVVKLEFNSTSGTSKVVRTIEVGSSKLEAAERFKIIAAEEGLV
jgi:FlaG/FlaF family flagellin (archaellin)